MWYDESCGNGGDVVQMEFDGLSVDVTYKKMKNMYIRIENGAVRVSVPLKTTRKQLAELISLKRGWILDKLGKSSQKPPPMEFHDGATVFLWGKPRLLRIYPCGGKPEVQLVGEQIWLYLDEGYDPELVLRRWYGQQTLNRSRMYFEKWEPVMGVSASEVRVRSMKTRWGTCVIGARRIWLSAALAEKPELCLEYIVVHELAHLLEKGHNSRFYGFMDRFLPDWRRRKAVLNGQSSFEEEPS